MEKGANINVNSGFGTPLMAAVVKNHHDIVEQLLQSKADVNLSDESGTTALHYATMFKNTNTIQILLDAGADIHSLDAQNYSPLDYAVMYNDSKLIALLLYSCILQEEHSIHLHSLLYPYSNHIHQYKHK